MDCQGGGGNILAAKRSVSAHPPAATSTRWDPNRDLQGVVRPTWAFIRTFGIAITHKMEMQEVKMHNPEMHRVREGAGPARSVYGAPCMGIPVTSSRNVGSRNPNNEKFRRNPWYPLS